MFPDQIESVVQVSMCDFYCDQTHPDSGNSFVSSDFVIPSYRVQHCTGQPNSQLELLHAMSSCRLRYLPAASCGPRTKQHYNINRH